VAGNGIRPAVIQLSMGTRTPSTRPDRTWENTIISAVDAGVVVVVAVGNFMNNACLYSPAYVESAIRVGATNSHDHRWFGSNWGNCVGI